MATSQEPDPRTGIFTTGSIAQIGPLSAALCFTGQNHAGENLNQLLKRRATRCPKNLKTAVETMKPQIDTDKH